MKTWISTSMLQDCFTNLSILHIENNLTNNYGSENILNVFEKSSRMLVLKKVFITVIIYLFTFLFFSYTMYFYFRYWSKLGCIVYLLATISPIETAKIQIYVY